MKAVLVQNDVDDSDLIEVEVADDSRYVNWRGRIFEYCGTEDGIAFFSDL